MPAWKQADGFDNISLSANGECLLLQMERAVVRNQDGREIDLAWPEPRPRFISHAQRLPDGGLAVASCRALPNEPNLFLFDAGGQFRKSIAVGDAINHFLIDGLGRFWFGYFDEGIFNSELVNAAGIACFDPDGRCVLGASVGEPVWPFIADCYAMTLDTDNRAWICTYTDFPLGYIENGRYQPVMETAPTHGAGNILVDETHVALVGGYDRRHAVTLIDRSDFSWRQIDLLTDQREPLVLKSVACRADLAVCYDGKGLFRFTLADLVAG
jgi:hypothetical protein